MMGTAEKVRTCDPEDGCHALRLAVDREEKDRREGDKDLHKRIDAMFVMAVGTLVGIVVNLALSIVKILGG